VSDGKPFVSHSQSLACVQEHQEHVLRKGEHKAKFYIPHNQSSTCQSCFEAERTIQGRSAEGDDLQRLRCTPCELYRTVEDSHELPACRKCTDRDSIIRLVFLFEKSVLRGKKRYDRLPGVSKETPLYVGVFASFIDILFSIWWHKPDRSEFYRIHDICRAGYIISNYEAYLAPAGIILYDRFKTLFLASFAQN